MNLIPVQKIYTQDVYVLIRAHFLFQQLSFLLSGSYPIIQQQIHGNNPKIY
jgi:hypothetical protein